MAFLHSLPPIAIAFFLISLPPSTFSQDPSSPAAATIADCTPRLLPLAACAPFVQGTVQSPAQACCDNLNQLYKLVPQCLCLLLNDTTLSSFPINTTLALHLPVLCSLQDGISACSGVPPSSPSQLSLGVSNTTNSNSTASGSPMASPEPPKHPGMIGLGFRQSSGMKFKTDGGWVIAVAMVASLLTKIS